MSKKLQGNGLFESSRMMLPEHKEAFIAHQRRITEKPRPQIDEQELERISQMIAQSFSHQREVTFILYGKYETSRITGRIAKINQHQNKIQLTQTHDAVWINIADIIDAVWHDEGSL